MLPEERRIAEHARKEVEGTSGGKGCLLPLEVDESWTPRTHRRGRRYLLEGMRNDRREGEGRRDHQAIYRTHSASSTWAVASVVEVGLDAVAEAQLRLGVTLLASLTK